MFIRGEYLNRCFPFLILRKGNNTMAMEDYKPNSNKYKEGLKREQTTPKEERKFEKVVTGKATVQKKGELRKFAEVFVAEDINKVKSYAIWEVVVPTIKEAIVKIVKTGIEMLVWGDAKPSSHSSSSKVSYRSYYDRDNDRDRGREPVAHSRFDFEDIEFDYRGDAEAVLDQMEHAIRRYGVVSIADMYDMADLSAPPYTSTKYGWTNINSADVVRSHGKYIIRLPRPKPID